MTETSRRTQTNHAVDASELQSQRRALFELQGRSIDHERVRVSQLREQSKVSKESGSPAVTTMLLFRSVDCPDSHSKPRPVAPAVTSTLAECTCSKPSDAELSASTSSCRFKQSKSGLDA